jgi:hypothetical protein
MGTIVFQATLGGAVNLNGPNIASTINFTLPSADGSSGQALVTNGSGTLSFSTFVSAAAGSNTQVQYNSSGAFAGSANLTFNGTTLTAAGLAGPHNGSVGATTPSTGAFTTLSASSTVSGSGFNNYLASPPSIGGTSPNTGNFTYLTTSSTITDNGGTANGVTYLNGSKVVTSGTVLRFDGINLISDRSVSTVYSGTNQATWGNGIVINNSATPATGILDSIYFSNNANMQNVFGVTQNASGYGDFVWAGNSGSYTEWMRLSSSGLTLTSNPTLSGGTANGVTYLNGSKVLTSGSALTFDGTNLGVGLSSTNGKLNILQSLSGAATSTGIWLTDNATTSLYVNNISSGLSGIWSSGALAFGSNNGTFAEGMRLTSSSLYTASGINVGIGTSSPVEKLTVNGAIAVTGGITGHGANRTTLSQEGANGAYWQSYGANTSTYGTFKLRQASSDFSLARVAVEIDTSGNLGLGVTPSAWYSARKAFQTGVGASLQGSTGTYSFAELDANALLNASNNEVYIGNDYATKYRQNAGVHAWYTAASGTAGNAITFTQAMTLDASGNWVVGGTSVLSRANIYADSSAKNLALFGRSSDNASTFEIWNNAGSTRYAFLYADSIETQLASGGARPLEFFTNGTERARIDSSGTFRVKGAGTAGSTDAFQVSGSATASAVSIDSSGNLLVGTTNSDAKLNVSGSASTGVTARFSGSSNATNPLSQFITSDTTGNPYLTLYYTDSSSSRGSVQYNRGTGFLLYNTTSDYRAKDILGPVTDSGAVIDSTPVYIGKMKGATQSRPMFIAHETPSYAHTGEKDAVDADGNPVYQQMDASTLVPVMWAEIQSLRKRLADAGIA